MPKVDELRDSHVLHSVRSDGSQMIALHAGQADKGAEWEILFIQKDGRVDNDGTMTLNSGEKAVFRKVHNDEQFQQTAQLHDFVEWRPGPLAEHSNEEILVLQDKLEQARVKQELTEKQFQDQLEQAKVKQEATDKQLQDTRKQLQTLTSQRRAQKNSRVDLEVIEQSIRDTAASVAARTPSETQKIIANQVELGAGFYEEVGVQSRDSFRLSLWLTAAGGVIFLLTALATVLITLLRGNSTLITIIGSTAAAITEGLAASNRLYNSASKQFADFQVDLDRINRSSIGYSMVSDESFDKKTEAQRDAIVKIADSLQQSP